MSQSEQCQVCHGALEVRDVNPCFVCGGWPGVSLSKPEHHFTIRDDGARIILCHFCWLEEVLADQGDLKARIRIAGDDDLALARRREPPMKDKFCPDCNRRLALLRLMATRLSDDELDSWRQTGDSR